MRAGKCPTERSRKTVKSRPVEGNLTGVWVTNSDTISGDSRVPFIPFWEGRRQTEHAAQWSTIIPCFLHPHGTTHFRFWIQPVAAISEGRLRQQISYQARPEEAGGKVTDDCQELSRPKVLPMGNPHAQFAAVKAVPEVSTCR